MRLNEFIEEISNEILINKKRITLFIGSGFSVWFGYPSWKGLLINYCNNLVVNYPNKKEFIESVKISVNNIPLGFQMLIDELNLSDKELKEYIKNKFKDIENINKESKFNNTNLDFEKYKKLQSLSKYCKIITTNYDTLIENIFLQKLNSKVNVYYSDEKMLNRKFFNSQPSSDILKIHGCVNREDLIVVSENDYTNIRSNEKFKTLRAGLKSNFASNINIFLGYSVSDENIKELLLENKEVFGEDKEKSYVFNIKDIEAIKRIDETPIELQESYKEIDVSEIFINSHDEIITVLECIDTLYKLIEENRIENNHITLVEVDDNLDQEKCGLAIYCYNNRLYNQARILIESILKDYHLIKNKPLKDFVEINMKGMLGVIYDVSDDLEVKSRGNKILNEIINKYYGADFILEEIGKLYLVRGIDKNYNSTVMNTLGVDTRYNYEAIQKSIVYISRINKKNETNLYNLMEAYSILRDLTNLNKIIKKMPKESEYYKLKDLFLGNCYFNKAVEKESLDDKDVSYIQNQYKKAIKYYEKHMERIDEDDRINVLSNITRTCMMTQKYEKSKLYCEMLLNKSGNNINIHKHLIKMYAKEGRFDDVINECNYELNHLKDGSKVKDSILYIKAQSIYARASFIHEVEESISICKDILTRNKYFDVAVSIVNMYMRIGYMKEMRESCFEAYRIYPLNNDVYELANNLASGHFSGEEVEYNIEKSFEILKWIENYKEEFIKNNPNVEEREFILEGDRIERDCGKQLKSRLVEEMVDINDVILSLEYEIDNITLELLQNIVKYYNECKYIYALELIKKLELKKHNYLLMFIYANTLRYTENIEKALETYDYLLKKYIDLYDVNKKKSIYFLQGDCYFYKKEYVKAHDSYVNAYKLDYMFKEAIYNIYICKRYIITIISKEEKINQLKLCRELLKEYIKLDNYRYDVYLGLRDTCYMIGDIDGMIDGAIKSRMLTVDYNESIASHYIIIAGYMIKEMEENIEYYIDSAEHIISSVGMKNLDNIILSQYYTIKGVYYKRYSNSKTLEAFKAAYELDKSEFNKSNLEKELNGVNHIQIKYGEFIIFR